MQLIKLHLVDMMALKKKLKKNFIHMFILIFLIHFDTLSKT